AVSRNLFLKEIFPFGIKGNVRLGKVELDHAGRVSICIHTRQEPGKEIKKWGKWGVDYNVIAIEITLDLVEKVEIMNWQNMTPCQLVFSSDKNIYSILFHGGDWRVLFSAQCLTFQGCSVYIDAFKDELGSSHAWQLGDFL
ncbi:MAG: immunity 50 family protein, partial [Zoogloeaceae bacterium]|nr:immunity 50 family protein [Zoogloeaceae bacterium]